MLLDETGGHVFGTPTVGWRCQHYGQQGLGCERLVDPQNCAGAEEFSWTFHRLQNISEGVLLHCCCKTVKHSCEVCEAAFTALQRALVEAPIVARTTPLCHSFIHSRHHRQQCRFRSSPDPGVPHGRACIRTGWHLTGNLLIQWTPPVHDRTARALPLVPLR